MRYGTEVIMRGMRYFDYRRIGQPDLDVPQLNANKRLWQFKTLGEYDKGGANTNEAGYRSLDQGEIHGAIVSSHTEAGAVEILRLMLNPDGMTYDATHWNLELLGYDTRSNDTEETIYIDWGYYVL